MEGYGPAEIRRVWTIVSCQRDLGINLAGVEVVLRLRDHLEDVHRRLQPWRMTSARPWNPARIPTLRPTMHDLNPSAANCVSFWSGPTPVPG